MIATAVTGLVEEAILKIASRVIGFLDSMSLTPCAS